MAWFQVDDQLAMHRKVCDAGNAAMGLWVRAGAWSMQNLTEGFIPSKAAKTLGTAPQASSLVNAGLWLQTEGGYQFHEWGTRQMSAEQIAERRRKRAEAGRKGGQSKKAAPTEAKSEANALPNAQASAEAEHKQNGTPVPVPVLSVVTREGNVALVDAHEANGTPPSSTCPKHPNGTDLRCHTCGEARKQREAWDTEQAQRHVRERADFWAAVRACPECDDRGLIDGGDELTRCLAHDWGLIHA